MTPAQNRKYRWEWSKVRTHLVARGMGAGQCEKERHAIHVRALGKDKSSTRLTNADFDKVIAAFRAAWDAGNLDAQLRQIDQAEKRVDILRTRIARLAEECGIADGEDGLDAYFRDWLKGRTVAGLNERELQQLAGILERRRRQLPEPVAVAASEDDGNPF